MSGRPVAANAPFSGPRHIPCLGGLGAPGKAMEWDLAPLERVFVALWTRTLAALPFP